MNNIERKKIIKFFKDTEEKYDINDWKYNEMTIWPIIKISIFFHLYSKNITKTLPKSKIRMAFGSFYRFLRLDVIRSFFYFKNFRLETVPYVFTSQRSYRVDWNTTFFNRYFDPIMDEFECFFKKDSLIFELDRKVKRKVYYREDRTKDISQLYPYFWNRTKKTEITGKGFHQFSNFLNDLEKELNIKPETLLERLNSNLHKTLSLKELWLFILKKTKPKFVFILNYYDYLNSGLILASKELGIKTIDMQHGGQGSFHPAYSYGKVPASGYSILPDYFWTWDEGSNENINDMLDSTGASHKAILGGNPWIDFLNYQKISIVDLQKKVILYTLQPIFSPILHSYIIDAIKETSEEYIWYLRLHPRMSLNEKDELNKILVKNDIIDKVEIDKASKNPLPILLSNCFAHISHFSGSILEAALMQIDLNIVIGEIGKEFYNDLVESKKAIYYNDNFEMGLFNFIQSKYSENNSKMKGIKETPDYKKILKSNIFNV